MAAKAPQQRNQQGRFPHCARQRVRLLWNKKRPGDRRATAALGAGISAALLSSTPASPLRDGDIKLRSLWVIPKGQERLFKGKLNGERRGEGLCGLSAVGRPWNWDEESPTRAALLLQSYRGAAPESRQSLSTRTPSLLRAPCAQHHPNPPLAPSHLPAEELGVKDGRTQPQQAAS